MNTATSDFPRVRSRGQHPAIAILWDVALGLFVGAMVTSVLFGRQPLTRRIPDAGVALVFILSLLAVTVWWLVYDWRLRSASASRRGHRSAGQSATRYRSVDAHVVPAIPLLVGCAVPVVAIYVSDLANHYFYYSLVYMNQPRSLALLLVLLVLSFILQAVHLDRAKGDTWSLAWQEALALAREPGILVLLGALGALQSAAYLGRIDNDFLRYWAIADAIPAGAAYPATDSGPGQILGGMTPFTVDLPLHGLLLYLSFVAFGHNLASAYIPLVLANVAIPPLAYLLFRVILGRGAIALSLAGLFALFPPLRFHTLNWPGSDATFVALLLAATWVLSKIVKGEGRGVLWWAAGLLAAALALTRPEGVAYAGIYLLMAVVARGGMRDKAAAVALAAIPIALFSLLILADFGLPWPRNWTASLGPQNVLGNWMVLMAEDNRFFAAGIRLSQSQLAAYSAVLLMLALIGTIPALYRPRRLAILLVPAWINVVSVFMVHPLVSGARLTVDFFRHLSYALPLFMMAGAVVFDKAARLPKPHVLRRASFCLLNLVLLLGVLWEAHLLANPSLNFGPDSGNLIGPGRANLVDLVANPFPLPMLGFEKVDGYSVPRHPEAFLANYPDPIVDFFSRFDAVRQSSGTAYENGSLLLYLAALGLALLPSRKGSPEGLRPSGGVWGVPKHPHPQPVGPRCLP